MIQSPLKTKQAGDNPFKLIHSSVTKGMFRWQKTWFFLQGCDLKVFTMFRDAPTNSPKTLFPEKLSWCSEATSKSKDLQSQGTVLLFFFNVIFDNKLRGVNFSSLGTRFQEMAQQISPD